MYKFRLLSPFILFESKDQVTASKPFELGYRIYDAKKVQSIAIHPTQY